MFCVLFFTLRTFALHTPPQILCTTYPLHQKYTIACTKTSDVRRDHTRKTLSWRAFFAILALILATVPRLWSVGTLRTFCACTVPQTSFSFASRPSSSGHVHVPPIMPPNTASEPSSTSSTLGHVTWSDVAVHNSETMSWTVFEKVCRFFARALRQLLIRKGMISNSYLGDLAVCDLLVFSNSPKSLILGLAASDLWTISWRFCQNCKLAPFSVQNWQKSWNNWPISTKIEY